MHPNQGERLLAATVAGRLVAVAAADVLQVLPMLPLLRPPTSPPPLLGFAGVGEGVLPVLSTRALLGLGEDAAPGIFAHIIRVARVGRRQAGLLVDRAEGFLVPSALEPVAAGDTLNGCATALFSHGAPPGGAVGFVIDPARLLDAAEAEMLAALAAEAEHRRAGWRAAP